MRRLRIAAPLMTLLASLAAFAGPALAAWPHSPFVNLPVSTAAGIQTDTHLVSDGAGGAIITWADARAGNFDIYAHHVLASGTVDPAWPVDGLAICTAAGDQVWSELTSDGAGGAIITWTDPRSGNRDIYAQRVLVSGIVDPAWPANGRALCTATDDQDLPMIISDGAGGAIATWVDLRTGEQDIYAQRVLASGVVDPGWPVDGRAVCTAVNPQLNPKIVSDGAGGAVVSWDDGRNGIDYDIYAQHIQASGAVDPGWPVDGLALCTAVGDQEGQSVVSDGMGGAIVAWIDERVLISSDIYAQHVLPSGVVDPIWPTDGAAVCTAGGFQRYPEIISDGAAGAIICWADYRGPEAPDTYAQHILANGTPDPAWPVDGVAVCTAVDTQLFPQLVSDGAGGAILTWYDWRQGGGERDIYAHHVLSTGTVDPGWPLDGLAVSIAPAGQWVPRLVSDGMNGAIITWYDSRLSPTTTDIFAQRVARFGYLGSPAGGIVGVDDVPNDQGGKVKVSWSASYLDLAQDPNLAAYDLYRSVPPNVAARAQERGPLRLLHEGAALPLRKGEIVQIPSAATSYAWEYLQTVDPNHFASQYSVLAPTAFDSIDGSNPETAFLILARNDSGSMFWPTPPDSGYSVDNLGPVTPAPFTGQYVAGTAYLHWDPNGEADLAGYRLYRGPTPDFEPGPGNLISAQPDTGYVDVAGSPEYYKLSAVDVHGNESPHALLMPEGTVDVQPGRLAPELAFAPPSPSPAQVSSTLRYALPRTADVTLVIYDSSGRRVRILVHGTRTAGEHAEKWDLSDDSGHGAGAGIYFAQLTAGDQNLVRRIVVMR